MASEQPGGDAPRVVTAATVDTGWRSVGERLWALRQLAALRGLSRERLRALAAALRPVDLAAGEIVCQEGALVDRLFVVVSGRLDRDDGTVDGVDLPPVDARYAVTVRAATPVRLWVLPLEQLRRLLPTPGEPVSGVRIEVRGVSQRAAARRRILRDISLTIEAGELVAIVGGSGTGKTTLLDVLAGVRPPAEGSVRYDGADYHADLAPFRSLLGYVPQDDIIHQDLPLARTLRYAARLRLPAGTTATQVDRAVTDVLHALDLTDRSGARVGSLSGGERKRASIAVELLTEPRVFFLDEPTSGLDPATAADLMRLLRRLADGGTTVVLTTHNPPDVDRCDKIAFLARDGHLAFFGSPAQGLAYFQTDNVEQIYERLADEDSPREWATRFACHRVTTEPDVPAGVVRERRADERVERRRQIGSVRQCVLLTRRNLDLLTRNRLTLAILVGSPIMVLIMFAVLFKPHAFAFDHPSPGATVMILFWVAFGGFFFGLTYGLLQICTELAILRRERLVGLRIGPYVLAKVAVLLPLLAVVDALTLGVLRALDRLPAGSWSAYASLFVTLLLSSAAALALGLLTSAVVSDPSQAAIALPMLCFPQVLFVGAILPVPVMAAGGRWVSYAMSNRWAFEGLGHDLGVAGLWARGGSSLGPPLLAAYGDTFSRPVTVDWAILGAFTGLFLALACVALVRRR